MGDGGVAAVGPAVLTGHAAKALKPSVGADFRSSVRAIEDVADLADATVAPVSQVAHVPVVTAAGENVGGSAQSVRATSWATRRLRRGRVRASSR